MKLTKYWLPPLVWALSMYHLSSGQLPATTGIYWQEFVIKKSAHIVEYAVLASLLYRAIKNYGYADKRTFIYALIISVGFAFTDEYHQISSPGRTPAITDLVFDTIGASTAGLLLWKYLPKAPKRLRDWATKLDLL